MNAAARQDVARTAVNVSMWLWLPECQPPRVQSTAFSVVQLISAGHKTSSLFLPCSCERCQGRTAVGKRARALERARLDSRRRRHCILVAIVHLLVHSSAHTGGQRPAL